MSENATPQNTEDTGPTVTFSSVQSKLFRVVLADGVIMDLTPSKSIGFSFYNERFSIADEATFKADAAGNIGEEIMDKRVHKRGVIREFEVQVVFPLAIASDLRNWLDMVIERQKPQQPIIQQNE